ncbi:DUF7144 family membrane protein [Streptomyces sp. HC307]|uniref:DUF7144 family membrane protein n=1 Tax=Streptomyces flavusporus TaxID=3385496 RepID=UPI00391730B6
MTDQPHANEPPVWDTAHRRAAPTPPPPGAPGALTGGIHFAGVLMTLNGILAIFQGIAAIAEDDVYARIGSYVYEINLTGWGVILLVLGVVALVTGWGILKGAGWARVAGIALASLSLIAQFLFLPYAPLWALILIAIDFFVIWALATQYPQHQRL